MLLDIINIIIIITAIYSGINLILYTPRIWCWVKAFQKQTHLINRNKNKLALIIPARNESKVIGELFSSIKKQTYPQELFDVYVVVKEENDPTIKMTQEIGGICYINELQTCKGEALDLCFNNILKSSKEYAGLIIVDADCILEEHFLEEMNNSLKSGREVFQAKKLVKNYLGSKDNYPMSSCCNGLIWPLMDDMGNLYKSNINVTNMAIGTGIMIKMSLVRKLKGWPYKETVTEDVEFMNDCALKDVKMYYNSYCKLYVEEATSLHVTNKRRSRWLKGVIDSNRIYHNRLENLKGINNLKNRYYTESIIFAIRYIGSLTVFAIVMAVMSTTLNYFDNILWKYTMNLSIIGILIIYISFFIMTIFCIAVDYKNIRLPFLKKLILLFIHPIFYMGYIPIGFIALVTRKSKKWDAVERIDFEMSGESNDN